MKKIIIFFSIIFNLKAEKILILTQVYNRPEFIELQHKLYKKFLKDEYELIIFDNSDNDNMTLQMNEICNKLNIKYIRIPQYLHTSNGVSERNAFSINYSFKESGIYHDGIVANVSSDIFLIKEFSISDYMKDYDIGGLYQSREHVEYLWDHIVFLKTKNLIETEKIDFGCGYVENVLTDVGGKLFPYLTKHKNLKIKYFNLYYIYNSKIRFTTEDNVTKFYNYEDAFSKFNFSDEQKKFIKSGINNIEFLIDSTFFHYRTGSMYFNPLENFNNHELKTQLTNKFISSIIK